MKRFLVTLLAWGLVLQSMGFAAVKPPITEKEIALVLHVTTCLDKADKFDSKVDNPIIAVHGMSSLKVRHFLNNLCTFPGTTYLEIGPWKGSTLISALYKNESTVKEAVAIDNWSEFEGPREEFFANIKKFIPNFPLKVIEADCFYVDPLQVASNPVNIYFYDGIHDRLGQERAFTYFNDAFDDVFIAVIDDWNWDEVKTGTSIAFEKLGYDILFERQLFTDGNGDMSSWWNGLYVGVIRKNHREE